MGLLDLLTSTKRPGVGTTVQSADEVRKRLQSLNRPTAPYRVMDGSPEGVDLIAEWKIVDTSWHEIFARAGLTKTFTILLKLRREEHEVRAMDREYTVSWSSGVPTVKLAVTAFRGQSQSIEFGKAYGFTETLAPGQVYNYRFNSSEIRNPFKKS
jgi:hypothetical protein